MNTRKRTAKISDERLEDADSKHFEESRRRNHSTNSELFNYPHASQASIHRCMYASSAQAREPKMVAMTKNPRVFMARDKEREREISLTIMMMMMARQRASG